MESKDLTYKVNPFLEPFGMSTSDVELVESIHFLTDLLQAKAFFLYQFGKLITLIDIDWKAKLDSWRS